MAVCNCCRGLRYKASTKNAASVFAISAHEHDAFVGVLAHECQEVDAAGVIGGGLELLVDPALVGGEEGL